MMRPDGRLNDDALKYWAGKLPGNTARLAALLHIAAVVPEYRPDQQEVSIETMEKGIAAAHVLIDHAVAVHDLACTDSKRHRAILILDWLRRHSTDDGKIDVRSIHQSLKSRTLFRRASDVRDGISVLLEHGYLFPWEPPPGEGTRREPFLVHPDIGPQYPQSTKGTRQESSRETGTGTVEGNEDTFQEKQNASSEDGESLERDDEEWEFEL